MMKWRYLRNLLLGVGVAPIVYADLLSGAQLQNLYLLGDLQTVVEKAPEYLSTHPADGDVGVILGKIYFDQHEDEKAKKVLSNVLDYTPGYVDASLILANVELTSNNPQKALDIINRGLIFNPSDMNLLSKKISILSRLEVKKMPQKVNIKIHTAKSNPSLSLPKPEKKSPVTFNEIGTLQQQYYISDRKTVWDYSTLYYGRETPVGRMYGKINYANRLGYQAVQGEFEAYPKITKTIYLDLDFAFANEPHLFPDETYGAAVYAALDKGFDGSIGAKYNQVDRHHRFNMYTAMLAKELGSNRIMFRPYYFSPNAGDNSTLYTVDFRHMLNDPYYYVGILIGLGSSPDLANLTTVDFLVLQNKIISPYLNLPFLNDTLILNINLLYQNQVFPGGKVRDWSGAALNLVWKY